MSRSNRDSSGGIRESVKSLQADLVNQIPHFKQIKLEDGSKNHTSGYTYTAFSSGCTYLGKEIYVCRSADGHRVPLVKNNCIIFYVREEDSSFSTKIMDIPYISDFRDPNLVTTEDGLNLILTLEATLFGEAGHSTYLYLLGKDLTVLSSQMIIDSLFGWGNVIQTPTNKFLKTAYNPDTTGGVILYRSSGVTPTNLGTFSAISTIFPPSVGCPTECNIARWGNRLIAITRQNNDITLYSETYNLEGDSGWSVARPIVNAATGSNLNVVSPCIEPYINDDDPLILTVSGFITSGSRDVNIIGTYDAITWTGAKLLVDVPSNGGGYNAFVRNRFGYGLMWYEDFDGAPNFINSNLWFKDIDLSLFLPELKNLKINTQSASVRAPSNAIYLFETDKGQKHVTKDTSGITSEFSWYTRGSILGNSSPVLGGGFFSDGVTDPSKNYIASRTSKLTFYTSPPVIGTWAIGDICLSKKSPYSPPTGIIGWVCSGAGTPGTWVPFYTLAKANVVWTPGTISAGNTVTQSITITSLGLTVGDYVDVSPPSEPADGLIIQAFWVDSTILKIKITNVTANPITAPSGTYNVKVQPK